LILNKLKKIGFKKEINYFIDFSENKIQSISQNILEFLSNYENLFLIFNYNNIKQIDFNNIENKIENSNNLNENNENLNNLNEKLKEKINNLIKDEIKIEISFDKEINEIIKKINEINLKQNEPIIKKDIKTKILIEDNINSNNFDNLDFESFKNNYLILKSQIEIKKNTMFTFIYDLKDNFKKYYLSNDPVYIHTIGVHFDLNYQYRFSWIWFYYNYINFQYYESKNYLEEYFKNGIISFDVLSLWK
jgi:hypothetical protein